MRTGLTGTINPMRKVAQHPSREEALRSYARSLPSASPLDIFESHGVVGAIAGPTDLSETYKDEIDFLEKHGTQ